MEAIPSSSSPPFRPQKYHEFHLLPICTTSTPLLPLGFDQQFKPPRHNLTSLAFPCLLHAYQLRRLENTVAAVVAPFTNDPAAELPVNAVTIEPMKNISSCSFLQSQIIFCQISNPKLSASGSAASCTYSHLTFTAFP